MKRSLLHEKMYINILIKRFYDSPFMHKMLCLGIIYDKITYNLEFDRYILYSMGYPYEIHGTPDEILHYSKFIRKIIYDNTKGSVTFIPVNIMFDPMIRYIY